MVRASILLSSYHACNYHTKRFLPSVCAHRESGTELQVAWYLDICEYRGSSALYHLRVGKLATISGLEVGAFGQPGSVKGTDRYVVVYWVNNELQSGAESPGSPALQNEL